MPSLYPSADITPLVLDGEALSAATAPILPGKPKNHKKRGKAARVAKARAAIRPSSYKIRLNISTKYKNDKRVELPKLRMLTLKTVALGAWIGRQCAAQTRCKTLEELLAEGLRLVRWDGK